MESNGSIAGHVCAPKTAKANLNKTLMTANRTDLKRNYRLFIGQIRNVFLRARGFDSSRCHAVYVFDRICRVLRD